MVYQLYDLDWDRVIEEDKKLIKLKERAKISFGIPLSHWSKHNEYYVNRRMNIIIRNR